jgi:hypothetical protein
MTIRVRQEPIDLVREFGVLCAIDILEPVLHETQAGMRSAVISTVGFWWEGGEEERKRAVSRSMTYEQPLVRA